VGLIETKGGRVLADEKRENGKSVNFGLIFA
jgi:hypothetical protein